MFARWSQAPIWGIQQSWKWSDHSFCWSHQRRCSPCHFRFSFGWTLLETMVHHLRWADEKHTGWSFLVADRWWCEDVACPSWPNPSCKLGLRGSGLNALNGCPCARNGNCWKDINHRTYTIWWREACWLSPSPILWVSSLWWECMDDCSFAALSCATDWVMGLTLISVTLTPW